LVLVLVWLGLVGRLVLVLVCKGWLVGWLIVRLYFT